MKCCLLHSIYDTAELYLNKLKIITYLPTSKEPTTKFNKRENDLEMKIL